jgi:hypothetical protein
MKVIPYEHKGQVLRETNLTTVSQANSLLTTFRLETDIWLKKIIALKLLEFTEIDKINIDKNELIKATKCQIEL